MTLSMAVCDLQRLGIKRSRLELGGYVFLVGFSLSSYEAAI